MMSSNIKKTKINKKACTQCGLEAAVARKVCEGCNTPFQSKRPTYFYEVRDGVDPQSSLFYVPSTSAQDSNEENGRRRTERVKREKPQFYDASAFQKTKKKKTDRRNAKTTAQPTKSLNTQMKKREKQRLKEMKLREAMIIEMENVYDNVVTPRKADQLAIILEELNTKMFISSWKP